MKKFFVLIVVMFVIVAVLAMTPNAFPVLHGLGAVWSVLERFAGILGDEIDKVSAWIDSLRAGDFQLSTVPIAIWVLALNIVTFIVYFVDKIRAEEGKFRISNRMLLGLAAMGGSIGSMAAMFFCHHKTKKVAFAVGIPFMLVAQLALLAFLHP